MSPLRAVESAGVAFLICLAACAASVGLVLTVDGTWRAASHRPAVFALFAVLTLGLQLLPAELSGRGSVSVAGIGVLATGFTLGPGPAMVTAAVCSALHLARRRERMHKAIFSTSAVTLAAGAAAFVYELVPGESLGARFGAAALAGTAYSAVTIALLCYAGSLEERAPVLTVWRERFRWLAPHCVAFGPSALAAAVAFDRIGVIGLFAFVVPPALMLFSFGRYLERTRQSVHEVRDANEELRRANAELATRNDDLQALFQFAGGLAARAHDRAELVAYTEQGLERLTGARTHVRDHEGARGQVLVAGGKIVGRLEVEDAPHRDGARWGRLREAILPQLATAIESADLVDRIRRTHLATIAALSRSMEAKDFYTGGHTERVASVAVALGRRLGYGGADLEAVEVGALLHDIGKIGIPESILQKPGPLDEEEWRVMKEHPVISEYILSEVDLHPIVLQIARSSHERIDGEGYPDGRSGDEIPLPARIVLVADALDALTSDRPYRRSRTVVEALDELRAHAGTQFCPIVIEAIERLHEDDPGVLGGAGRVEAISFA